jgi:hypothetical protein
MGLHFDENSGLAFIDLFARLRTTDFDALKEAMDAEETRGTLSYERGTKIHRSPGTNESTSRRRCTGPLILQQICCVPCSTPNSMNGNETTRQRVIDARVNFVQTLLTMITQKTEHDRRLR